jgi:hypothetical protein
VVRNVLLGFGFGVVTSLLATAIWDWSHRTRVEFCGFTWVEIEETAGSGMLYKIALRIHGRGPGSSCLEMQFPSRRGREVEFAKWDEAANPVDGNGAFVQWLVPLGYYQPLVPGRMYVVPLMFVGDGRQEIFCGWWFGIPDGLFEYRAIEDDAAEIDLVLTGSGMTWSRTVTPLELRERGKPRLSLPVRTR